MHTHKVALVTGANKGIGYAIASELAARGLTVLVAARDAARGEAAAGRVVNLSSRVGSLSAITDPAFPMRGGGGVAYGPSKTALNAVTIAFAQELEGTAVKVNLVCPGHTATDLNGHSGARTVTEAAREPVRLALLGPEGPTGPSRTRTDRSRGERSRSTPRRRLQRSFIARSVRSIAASSRCARATAASASTARAARAGGCLLYTSPSPRD